MKTNSNMTRVVAFILIQLLGSAVVSVSSITLDPFQEYDSLEKLKEEALELADENDTMETFSPTWSFISAPTQYIITRPSSLSPTSNPSSLPTVTPSKHPTKQPTKQPSSSPTFHPTSNPSSLPTVTPSKHPTKQPTKQPSSSPTFHPTSSPSLYFSSYPSIHSSSYPSINLSSSPSTFHPTSSPSLYFSSYPSIHSSSYPSINLSSSPSTIPTPYPSISSYPSTHPSFSPTYSQIPTTILSVIPSTPPSYQNSSQPSFPKQLIESQTSDLEIGGEGRSIYLSTCYNPNTDEYDLGREEMIRFSYVLRVKEYSDPVPVLSSLEKRIQDEISNMYLDCKPQNEDGESNNRRVLLTTSSSTGIHQISSAPADIIDSNSVCSISLNETEDGEDCYVIEGGITYTWSASSATTNNELLNLQNSTLFSLRLKMSTGYYDNVHENITFTSFRGISSFQGTGVVGTSSIVKQVGEYISGEKPITVLGAFVISFFCIVIFAAMFLTGRVVKRKIQGKKNISTEREQMFGEEESSGDDDYEEAEMSSTPRNEKFGLDNNMISQRDMFVNTPLPLGPHPRILNTNPPRHQPNNHNHYPIEFNDDNPRRVGISEAPWYSKSRKENTDDVLSYFSKQLFQTNQKGRIPKNRNKKKRKNELFVSVPIERKNTRTAGKPVFPVSSKPKPLPITSKPSMKRSTYYR